MDVYQVIETIDPKDRLELFRWFLEAADDIWFTNPPQEQENSSVRDMMLNQILGEDDAAKLLELLQAGPIGMSDAQPDSSAQPITADAKLTAADVTSCRARYSRCVSGLLDRYSNEGYSAQEYYRLLLTAFDSLMSGCTAEEKGICLYTILIDKRTPYQEVPKGLCLSAKAYRRIIGSIQPALEKMRYVLVLRNTYPTEPASQLLHILEGLESDEEKTVFISELMGELQPDEDD